MTSQQKDLNDFVDQIEHAEPDMAALDVNDMSLERLITQLDDELELYGDELEDGYFTVSSTALSGLSPEQRLLVIEALPAIEDYLNE